MTNFISIQEAMKKGKGKVSVRGWVHRQRGSNKIKFIILRDSSNIIQCILEKSKFEKTWDDIDKVQVEYSLQIHGDIKKDERAPSGYEISVSDYQIIGTSDKFPIQKNQSKEFLADNRHLWLRSRRMTAILKIRSTVFDAIHNYFRTEGFYEYHSPIFQAVQCEGGSTLFDVPYFGKKGVFLSQTWQLYAEPAIFALEKIYAIEPAFRAEKSVTSRHITELWMCEMEFAWATFDEIINHGEGLIKHVVKKVLDNNKPELEILERDIKKLEPTVKKKFPRMTYDDVLKLLKDKFKLDIPWGKDLRTIEEDKLSELFDTPIAVTRYPKQVKAFYMKEPKDSNKKKPVVNGVDFIAPEHYGEIIGGSEREPDIKEIQKRLDEEGEDPKEYEFYLDTRRYGSVPHGGFGMGIERIISWICGLDTIKDAIAFPRTPERYTP